MRARWRRRRVLRKLERATERTYADIRAMLVSLHFPDEAIEVHDHMVEEWRRMHRRGARRS